MKQEQEQEQEQQQGQSSDDADMGEPRDNSARVFFFNSIVERINKKHNYVSWYVFAAVWRGWKKHAGLASHQLLYTNQC